MSVIEVQSIGTVKNNRKQIIDDEWGDFESIIELASFISEDSLVGIEKFSHLEIIYYLHLANQTEKGCCHPRGNSEWPKTGIFAQRKKDRPNHIGSTIVILKRVEGCKLYVQKLDALNGTPVIDIKPVFRQFLPSEKVIQPDWVDELMRYYW